MALPLLCCFVTNVRFGSKADVKLLNFDVRFAPESGHSPTRSGCLLWAKLRHMQCSKYVLFNHVGGGGEHFGWNVEAECAGGIEVDYKFELGRLHHR
jgi:hypothetical protein